MIIAIDGPAGSGKTTIGRMVAEALGFVLVDTGLFYRAVTVEARRRGIDATDVPALTQMAGSMRIDVDTSPLRGTGPLLSVDGRDVGGGSSSRLPAARRRTHSSSRKSKSAIGLMSNAKLRRCDRQPML